MRPRLLPVGTGTRRGAITWLELKIMNDKVTARPSNPLGEIRQRHERASRLLQIAPGAWLGPMDSDAAHADRGKLLVMFTRLQYAVIHNTVDAVDPELLRGAIETEEVVPWFYRYQALVAACLAVGLRPDEEDDPNYGGKRTTLIPTTQISPPTECEASPGNEVPKPEPTDAGGASASPPAELDRLRAALHEIAMDSEERPILARAIARGALFANSRTQKANEIRGSDPHDGKTLCPPESRCSECWPENANEHVHDWVYADLKHESCYCGAVRVRKNGNSQA
ncbi:MAG: hypothetical protein JWO52_4117 [Gammaproteobacteria bacterium]|nr:hypothetical protein [Gammaproteobacteria bacterium]